MKIPFRSILFALVIPVAACGGDSEPTVDFKLSDYVVQPKSDAQPIKTQPSVVGNVVKVVDVTKPMPTKLDELMAEGKRLASAGKYGDAKIMFDAALKQDKKNASIHIEMARMYISMNEKGPAVASANKAVKLAPLSSQAWNTKGRAELTAHKYDEAIEAFSKAVELDETNVFAWNNLGFTELLIKKYEDAVTHLQEATGRPGATGYMFNNLGTALEHVDNLDDARVAYEAGGKLGSSEAASSRKRLEGVDSVAVATAEPTEPVVKEYETVNESDIVEDSTFPPTTTDEPADTTETAEGSGHIEEDGAQGEPSDKATL